MNITVVSVLCGLCRYVCLRNSCVLCICIDVCAVRTESVV